MKNKGTLLAAAFAAVTFVSLAFAAATKLTDLTVTGAAVINGNTTLGDAVGDVTTMTGQLALQSNAAPRTNVTPSRAGSLVWDSAGLVVCVSTGATKNTWALLTSTSTACPH